MTADLKVFIVIVNSDNVLLQQTGEDLFRLPSIEVAYDETVLSAASQVLRSLYIASSTQMKHVIGVYEQSIVDQKIKHIGIGIYALCNKLSPQTHGRLYEHTAIESYIEKEKSLEDPSFAAKILNDYLSGSSYPLDLFKMVEELKM